MWGYLPISWTFRKRIVRFVRSSLWLVPALAALGAFLSTPFLRLLDKTLNLTLLHFSSEGARGVGAVVSAAMLSFLVFFFSVLLLTVQIASSTLSPRIISRPFRYRTLKVSIALFVLTLIYSMALVARGMEGNVGQLTTAIVLILTLISICSFLYVVEFVSKQLRPITVMENVASDGIKVIHDVYPEVFSESTTEQRLATDSNFHPPTRIIVHRRRPGVVLAIDVDTLVELAGRHACMIEIVPEVGDFVATGDPVFRIYGGGAEIADKKLLERIVLDQERTLEQDPAFAFRIIVDIASKALSPAINDPTTAVIALDQIHHLLREVGMRRLDTGLVYDEAGQLRLAYHTPDWEDFVGLAVTEIRQFGVNSTQVARRMRAMLENLIEVLPPSRCVILRKELELLKATVERGFPVLEDKRRAESADFQGLGGRRKAS